MSTNPAQAARSVVSARTYSFLEDGCHDRNDHIKFNLTAVVFRIYSVGTALGPRVDSTFVADYGIYYDSDDDPLIRMLIDAVPHVDWRDKIFHRNYENPRIDVINPETDKVVARIETRRYFGRKVSVASVKEGRYGSNVVPFEKTEITQEAVK